MELIKMSFEDGKKFLESIGYVVADSATDSAVISDYVDDIYFYLFDAEGNETSIISYAMYYNVLDESENIDIIKQGWKILEKVA